jgi:hypothetical protein
LVNESGILNSTETLPVLSVTSDGVKFAIAVKLLRTSMDVEASSTSGTDAEKLPDTSLSFFTLGRLALSATIGLATYFFFAVGDVGIEGAIFRNNATSPTGGAPLANPSDELLEEGISGVGGFGAFLANFCKSSEL